MSENAEVVEGPAQGNDEVESAHAGQVAEVAGGGLEKRFDADIGGWFQPRLRLYGGGYAVGQGGTRVQGQIEATGEESLQDFKIGWGEFCDARGGKRKRVVGLGYWRWMREERCSEGARACFGPEGCFLLLIANDQSAGGQVAESLVLASDEHGYDSDGVEEGNLINIADEVAGHRFEDANGAARLLNDTDAGDALSGGAAVPEGLEECEVSPVEKEDHHGEERGGPLIGEIVEGFESGPEHPAEDAEEHEAGKPDQSIDQQCDKAAADAGQRHLDGHQLGSIDVKLI